MAIGPEAALEGSAPDAGASEAPAAETPEEPPTSPQAPQMGAIPPEVLEAARERLDAMMPELKEWRELDSLLPRGAELGADPPPHRSVRASSMLAALEITKDGHARLRQREAFAPIYVRGATDASGDPSGAEDAD